MGSRIARYVATEQQPRLILLRDRIDASAPPHADPDHANGGVLQGEHILFHDGHVFFDARQIGDVGAPQGYNRTLVELVATMFEVAYLRSQRPDMQWFLEDRRSRPTATPRYATLSDFDYLNGVDGVVYFWFMFQLERIADALLSQHPGLAAGVKKAHKAFHGQRKSHARRRSCPPRRCLDRTYEGSRFARWTKHHCDGVANGVSTVVRAHEYQIADYCQE